MNQLSVNEIADAFRRVGVLPGDTVYAHSDLKRLGLIRNPGTGIELAATSSRVFDGLSAVLGPNGTVAVPAFSYNWSDGQVYSLAHSEARTGMFCEFVRKLPGARRSIHPILSIAAWGKNAREIVEGVGEWAFGWNSPYERLVNLNARVLMIGEPFTAVRDHAEVLVGVPYRYPKRFKGELEDEGIVKPLECAHYVRYQKDGRSLRVNANFLDGLREEERRLLSSTPLGTGHIWGQPIREMMGMLTSILEKEPYRFLREEFETPAVLEFINRASRYESRDGWGLSAIAERCGAGETWTWTLDDPIGAFPREYGIALGGSANQATISVGGDRQHGSEVCLAAARTVCTEADDEIAIGRFLQILAGASDSGINRKT